MSKKLIIKILDFIQFAILIPLTIIIFLWFTVGGIRKVDGYSMYPYFDNKDLVLLYKLAYKNKKPERGDVIVFQFDENNYFVKRVIGLPGETIAIHNGHVYINNKQLDESKYLAPNVYTSGGRFLIEDLEYTIPPNTYFVMGDNRPHSTDSRDIGPVPIEKFQGRILARIYPIHKIKLVTHIKYNISN